MMPLQISTRQPPIGATPSAGPPTATPAPAVDMEAVVNEASGTLAAQAPSLVEALAVLLVGWLLAVVLARVTRRVLGRAGLDQGAATLLGTDNRGQPRPLSRWLGQAVFYGLLLFTITAFFQRIGLAAIADPLTAITSRIVAMLPAMLAAVVLAILAWLVATLVRIGVQRGAAAAQLDERLAVPRELAAPDEEPEAVSRSLAMGASALVYLVFLVPILNVLGLTALSQPLESIFVSIVAFLPRLAAAAAILVAAWFIARLVSRIALGLLVATRVDAWGQSYGVVDVRPSAVIASVASALVMVPGILLAVEALGIPALSAPVEDLVQATLAWVPDLAIVALALGVALVIGRIAASVTATVLQGLGFNRLPAVLGFDVELRSGEATLSELAGTVVQVAILLIVGLTGARSLGMEALADFMSTLVNLGSRTLLAIAILVIGLFFSNLVHTLVLQTVGSQRRPLAEIARAALMVFVTAIALSVVGVGETIVNAAFIALVAALAGAVALAFGLGGRELAGGWLAAEVARLRADPEAETEPDSADPEP